MPCWGKGISKVLPLELVARRLRRFRRIQLINETRAIGRRCAAMIETYTTVYIAARLAYGRRNFQAYCRNLFPSSCESLLEESVGANEQSPLPSVYRT